MNRFELLSDAARDTVRSSLMVSLVEVFTSQARVATRHNNDCTPGAMLRWMRPSQIVSPVLYLRSQQHVQLFELRAILLRCLVSWTCSCA